MFASTDASCVLIVFEPCTAVFKALKVKTYVLNHSYLSDSFKRILLELVGLHQGLPCVYSVKSEQKLKNLSLWSQQYGSSENKRGWILTCIYNQWYIRKLWLNSALGFRHCLTANRWFWQPKHIFCNKNNNNFSLQTKVQTESKMQTTEFWLFNWMMLPFPPLRPNSKQANWSII